MGLIGEKLALQYERWELIKHGKEKLADQIRWISKEEGDGAGFDILSKNLNGTDKYIEVKSTKLTKETPFYFSRNELNFSIDHVSDYYLYRLFNIDNVPQMFIKQGGFDSICNSIAITFKGYF